MNNYRNVLVAIDVFGHYQKVLNTSLQLANADTIHLIYAVPPHNLLELFAGGEGPDMVVEMKTHAQKSLSEIAANKGIPSNNIHIPIGKPGIEILTCAEQNNVDLIVLGTHNQNGFKGLPGSTANKVVHGATCDVFVVRLKF